MTINTIRATLMVSQQFTMSKEVNNRDKISFKIPKVKTRAHKALFDNDLPFQHKVVNPKKGQYNRRPKHRNNLDDWEG